MVVSVYEGRLWDCVVVMELFLEIYHMFEEEEFPTKAALRDVFYWYVSDYTDETMEYRIREMVDPTLDFASGIVRKADLTDLRYLYRYGEYVTENERKTAEFLNGLPQEQIDAMARTYTEGYRIGLFLETRISQRRRPSISATIWASSGWCARRSFSLRRWDCSRSFTAAPFTGRTGTGED